MSETKTLNDLPEGIIIKILTFLPTIYAIRTSLISKQFLNLWHQTPNLIFNHYRARLNRRSLAREFYADFITQTLILRPYTTPLHTFYLNFDYRDTDRLARDVHAVESKASVLRLDFEAFGTHEPDDDQISSDDELGDDAFAPYKFHLSDFLKRGSSVNVIDLSSCELVLGNVDSGDWNFSSISSVTLDRVSVTNDDLYGLVTCLVNLEYLSIVAGLDLELDGLRDFRIYSKKLTELRLACFVVSRDGPAVGSLEICCPSLVKIRLDTFLVAEYFFKDLSSLVEVSVDSYFCNDHTFGCWWEVMQVLRDTCVERLKTSNMGFDRDGWLELLDAEDFSECFAFKNLKHLELKTSFDEDDINGVLAFLEVCSALESLVLDYCCEGDDKLSEEYMNREHVIHMPNLQKVEMKNYKGTENEMYFMKLLKSRNVVLREIVAYPPGENGKLLPPIVL